MTITYNRDIPAVNNNPSQDQPDLEVNTNAIDDFLLVDHIGFNTTDYQNGYHNVIHQPPQVADPANLPGFGQTYVKTVSGIAQLFFKAGDNSITQITNQSSTFITGNQNSVSPGQLTLYADPGYNYTGYLTLFQSGTGNSVIYAIIRNGSSNVAENLAFTGALNGLVGFTGNNLVYGSIGAVENLTWSMSIIRVA